MFKQKEEKPKKDERVVAKNELLRILRSHDEVSRTLGIMKTADDRTYLKALSKFSSIFDILRSAGCSIAEAAKATDLLDLALQAPVKKKKTSTVSRVEQAAKGVAGVLIFVLLILVFIIVWTLTQATAGWQVANCSLQLYQNQTCEQGDNKCDFEVMVRGEEGDWVTIKNWGIPIAYATVEGGISITRFYGDPFRCCNTGEDGVIGHCCDLYDNIDQSFCDNWGGYVSDFEGEPCPTNPWPCLYQMDENDEAFAKAVKPYEPADIMPFLIPVFMIVGLLFFGAFAMLLVRLQCSCGICTRACARFAKIFEEDELEDGDVPDDEKKAEEEVKSPKAEGGSPSQRKSMSGSGNSMVDFIADKAGRRPSAADVNDPALRRASTAASTALAPQDGRRSVDDSARRKSTGSESSTNSQVNAKRSSTISGRGSLQSTSPLELPGVPELEPDAADEASVEEASVPDPKKFMSWGSLHKEFSDLDENDLHVGFKTGDLSKLTRKAEMELDELLAPVVEPLRFAASASSRLQRPGNVGAAEWAWAGQGFDGQHIADASGRGRPAPRQNLKAARSDGFLQASKQARRPSLHGSVSSSRVSGSVPPRPTASRAQRGQPDNRASTAPGARHGR